MSIPFSLSYQSVTYSRPVEVRKSVRRVSLNRRTRFFPKAGVQMGPSPTVHLCHRPRFIGHAGHVGT